MFDFDGKTGSGSSRVNLAGRGNRNRTRGGEESRSDFVKRQHKEREAREKRRIQENAATRIQAVYRSYRCLTVAREEQRKIFDKRSADINKVGALLPADKKAKFVHLALPPMLRLFAFFFTTRQDAHRLTALHELMVFSAAQPLASNVFQAAVGDADAQRLSFLILLEKLIAACLRLDRTLDTLALLLALQTALFPAPDRTPVHATRSGAAAAHVLRRTESLARLSSEVLPQAGASGDPLAQSQAIDFVQLCCAGLESCSWAERQRPLVCLLATPRLCDVLCKNPSPQAKECLRRLVCALPGVPAADQLPPAFFAERVEGAPRGAWLLAGLADVLERHLMASGERGKALSSWIGWTSWAKEHLPVGLTSETPAATAPLQRLHSSAFVRSLIFACDKEDTEGLLAVCRLYFSADSAGDYDPPPEVLQTLAFATPLAERLFPTLSGLMHGTSVEAVFQALKPPVFSAPEAVRLRIFCAVYTLQMQPMYDVEFFGAANPLNLEEVKMLTVFLNGLAYHFVTAMPSKSSLDPAARALRTSVTSLVCLLYNRHCRRPILTGHSSWIIPESKLLIRRAPVVDLGDDGTEDAAEAGADDEDEAMPDAHAGEAADEPMLPPAGARFSRAGTRAVASTGAPNAERVLEAVLEEIPHVLPFTDRVELLHNVIQNDQAQRRDTRGPWAQAAMKRHQIRRNFLVEDGFTAFAGLSDEGALRDVFRVEFIAPDGEPESGVDGGGLFKEFMIALNRAVFDPEFGLFAETSDRTLYPAAGAYRLHDNAGELYAFVGKLVGKAIYEMFLLEPQFSRVFLNRLLGRTNEVDDVAALDRELHRSMLHINETKTVEECGLTFSVTVAEAGRYEDVDLIPNGRNVPVTKDNLTRYFHLMANFKTNVQFQRQTAAFLRGLQCVIPLSWLKMFDPYELNILVSGSTQGFDVRDLRRNTNYAGGYQDDSPVVQWLWHLLEYELDPEDLGRFLMFSTSCSRAPLLGFKTLFPVFCIHRVPDGVRLPTASTCANLLKLPDYTSAEVLKVKLLQAIRAEAGFDLS